MFFHTKYGTDTNLSVQMTSSTPGAIIFFTMGSNGQGYLDDRTHNGSTPINPTVLYYGPVSVPYSQVRYFAALKKNAKARKSFDAFAPSKRREYLEWITEAKREETRNQRLATSLQLLTEGKMLHWKYQPAKK